MLTVMWETKPEIVERLLPPPLEPTETPLVTAFVANYPKTNFGVIYLEGALFLSAHHKGEEGRYCLAMHVTNDMAMAGGREVFGFPKKMAEISLKRNGQDMEGWLERRGVRFFELRVKLTGKFNSEDAVAKLSLAPNAEDESVAIAYNFKHFPAPEGGGFDYSPRLVKQETEFSPTLIELGEAEVVMKPSDYDPWADVEIVKLLGAFYMKGNNAMRKGKTVAEVEPEDFAPYAFLKWDM
jgi:acetoacetate decarboxylase